MFACRIERWKKVAAMVLILILCLTMSACRVSPKLASYQDEGLAGTGQQSGEEQGAEAKDPDNALDFEAPETPDEPDTETIEDEELMNLGLPFDFKEHRPASENAGIEYRFPRQFTQSQFYGSFGGSTSVGSGVSGGASGASGSSGDSTLTGTGDSGDAANLEAGAISRFKTVIDAEGNAVELPMQVETLTATGVAAQMAEMLGGPGKLVAADASLTGSSLAGVLFSDAGSIEKWWTGDGTISETNFAKLLAQKPDVCVATAGQATFTVDQLARLEAADIPVVVLPAPDSVESLKQGVILMGQMMDDTGDGTGASAVARDYCDWVDTVVSEVSEKTGGIEMSAIYIAGWDDNATYTLTGTKGVLPETGKGLAYAYSEKKNELITDFMKAANVINESSRYADHFNQSEYAYVTPMFHQLGATVSGSIASYYSGAGYYDEAFDPFLTAEMTGYEGFTYQLGSGFYPSVIVNDTTTLARIQGNVFWQYREADETGMTDINGQAFQPSIGGPYNVSVNPKGLGNWAEGSLDSPLEAYWTAYVISMSYTLAEVKSETSWFYEHFFGVKLSNAALTNIFGE